MTHRVYEAHVYADEPEDDVRIEFEAHSNQSVAIEQIARYILQRTDGIESGRFVEVTNGGKFIISFDS